MELAHKQLTESIIGAAIEVHRQLGPGFLESIYENALVVELKNRLLFVEKQLEVPIFYGGVEVGKHRLDLLVERTIVVELKAIKDFEPIHFAIVKSYPSDGRADLTHLRAVGKEHGLILNFAKVRLQVKRVMA